MSVTKGKIIKVADFHIQLPDVPRTQADVLFTDYRPAEQFWRRQERSKYFMDFLPQGYLGKGKPYTKANQAETFYNSDGYLVSLSEEDSKLVKRELAEENHRRKYGVYAMMNGSLVHISGDYYYNLQWCQMKDLAEKYGGFRHVQNDFLTVVNWAKYEDWISSVFLAKCKKSGVTQIMSGAFLNAGTSMIGGELLMASKEFDHVKDVAMAYLFHAYDNLPPIMQPRSRKRNFHEIVWGKPTNETAQGTYLNTRIAAMKTKPSCFDGPVVKLGWGDEFPKWWQASKVSVQEAYNKMSETVKLQQKKNGLLIYTSYMPETDDRGFLEYRNLHLNSDISKRNEKTGQTPTGGIALEMTALEANEECFDKYGHCDQKKAYHKVTDEYNSKKTREDKQAHRRQYPTCKDDMFDSGGRGKTFDNIRLAIQAREVEEEVRSSLGTHRSPFKLGNLRWANPMWETGEKENRRPQGKFDFVNFSELIEEDYIDRPETASLRWFHRLPDELTNVTLRNNRTDFDDDAYTPGEGGSGVGSFDPSDYALKSDVAEGSTNAGHGGYVADENVERYGVPTNTLIFEYFFRHEDPNDTVEDLVKLILYTGFRFVIEANKKWLVTRIKEEGLHHFLLLKQRNGAIEPYKAGDENELVNATAEMKEAYCRSINTYFSKPKTHTDKDYLDGIKSPILLRQLMDFDIMNTKKYDAAVSFGWWRLAMDSYHAYRLEKLNNNVYDGDALQITFDNLLL